MKFYPGYGRKRRERDGQIAAGTPGRPSFTEM